MRQVGILPDIEQALILADYLLSLQIETQLVDEPDGHFAVWVYDEDRLPQAREELAGFTKAPLDARFVDGAKAERARRRNQTDEDNDDEAEKSAPAADANRKAHPATSMVMMLTIVISILAWPKTGNPLERVKTLPPEVQITARDNDPTLPEVREGQVWRLVAPALIHLSLVHWLFNILWLLDLGGQVEERRGALRFLILVLVLAVLSNLCQFYLGQMALVNGRLQLGFSSHFAGLSGVVYGLFGYVWIKSRMEPDLGFVLPPAVVFLLLGWLVFCFTPLAEKTIGPVANGAHLSGLLVGVAIGAVPAAWRSLRNR